MKYYYHLYGEKTNRSLKESYWIVLSSNEKNHLEIIHSVLYEQKVMSKEQLFVVGIAKDYLEALEVVEKITQEVYDKTNGVDIRNYILQNQREYEERNV